MNATELMTRERDNRPLACVGVLLCLPFYCVVSLGALPDLRVALVDLLPPLLLLLVCVGRCRLRIDRRIALALTVLAAATAMHSLGLWLLQDGIIIGRIAKETVKLLYSGVLLLSFAALFGDGVFNRIRIGHLIAVNVAFTLLAHTFQHLKTSGLDPSETLIGGYLVLAYLLLLRRLLHEQRVSLVTAAAYVLLGLANLSVLRSYQAVALYVTAIAGIASVGFLPIFRAGRQRNAFRAALAIAGIAVLASVFSPAVIYRWCLANSGTSSRLVMWQAAIESIGESFPVGIGLGQFPDGFLERMQEHGWTNKSLHNTILTLLLQMGAVGAGWLVLGTVLVYKAARRMPLVVAVNYLLIIGATFAVHDAHGLRSMLILLAFGATGWIELIPVRAAQPKGIGADHDRTIVHGNRVPAIEAPLQGKPI